MSYYDPPIHDWLYKREMAIAAADAEGFDIVYGQPHQILLDIDDDYEIGLRSLARTLGYVDPPWGFRLSLEDFWKSKSGNLHAIVELKPTGLLGRLRRHVKWSTRSRLAERLGSDPLRELLTAKVWPAIEEPSVLFKPKEK